jgi:hypothetical protein
MKIRMILMACAVLAALAGISMAYQTLNADASYGKEAAEGDSSFESSPNLIYATSNHCSSTVGINDFYARGVTKIIAGYWDVCGGDYWLRKYYCDNDNIKGELIFCRNGCKDGACLTYEPIHFKSSEAVIIPDGTLNVSGCYDSDNGLDYFKKATVVDATGLVKTDYCVVTGSGDLYTLREYSCQDSGHVASQDVYCPSECMGGRCKGDTYTMQVTYFPLS